MTGGRGDPLAAVAARERGRRRIRVATLAAGAAALATAGVVAAQLPGQAGQRATGRGTGTGGPATTPSHSRDGEQASEPGDDDDGLSQPAAVTPAPAGSPASHASSGGS